MPFFALLYPNERCHSEAPLILQCYKNINFLKSPVFVNVYAALSRYGPFLLTIWIRCNLLILRDLQFCNTVELSSRALSSARE